MKRNALILAFIIGITSFGLSLVLKTPPVVYAQQSGNNTAVFSGQFIPAFIGTAYDPSYAYQRLAGLPVYVFAYDNWNPAGGNFIINNLAIRTQIRADGSFQAQGVPFGQKYGVFFPFALNDSGAVVRIDNCQGDPCAADIAGASIQFRTPLLDQSDAVIDVFSYNLANPGGPTVQTQLGETITLGPSFLTQETRVDIDNNINTFPLIPNSTFKISVRESNIAGTTPSDEAYEVVAQRVLVNVPTGFGPGAQPYQAVETPIIGGRTIFPLVRSAGATQVFTPRIFQAYAPPGIYAVTVWRNESGVTYQNFGGSVGSRFHHFAFVEVGEDWNTVLSTPRIIDVATNHFVVWGRVLNNIGRIPADNPLNVNIKRESFNNMQPKVNCGSGIWSYGLPSCPPVGGQNTDNAFPSHGLYAFFTPPNPLTAFVPKSDKFWTYLSGGNVEKNPLGNDAVHLSGTNGPLRIDLLREPVITDDSGGILITPAGYPDPFQFTVGGAARAADNSKFNPAGIKAYIEPLPGVLSSARDISVIQRNADQLGRIYIPDGDLVEGVSYRIIVNFNDAEAHSETITYNGTLVRIQDIQFAVANQEFDARYKFLGLIPADFLMPGTRTAHAQAIATLPISLKDVRSSWESLTVKNSDGQTVRSYSQEELADEFALSPPRIDIPLTYSPAGTQCRVLALNEEACKRFIDQANTYEIETVADGKTFRQRFVVYAPFAATGSAAAIVRDPSWEVQVTSPCEPIVEQLRSTGATGQDRASRAIRTLGRIGDFTPGGLISRASGSAPSEAAETLAGVTSTLSQEGVEAAIKAVGMSIGCNVADTITPLIAKGFSFIHQQLIIEPLTVSIGVQTAWDAIRGISNIFFVFILLIIGLNQILGIDQKTWAAQLLLPQLILSIVLANFSLIIVQLILDINNVITTWLFSIAADILNNTGISSGTLGTATTIGGAAAMLWVAGSIISALIAAGIAAAVGTAGTALLAIIPLLAGLVTALFGMVVALLTLLYGRYLLIWLGVIIAPIAFALSVLPWFKSFRTIWWGIILPTAFIQTIMAFILTVGIILLTRGSEADSILAQFGTFLIGGATLYASLKSPQYASQLLGKGPGGAIFGKLSGVGAGLAAPISGKAGDIAGLAKSVNIPSLQEGYAKAKASNAEIKTRFAGTGLGTAMKIPGAGALIAGTVGKARYDRQQRLGKIVSEHKKATERGAAPPDAETHDDVLESIDRNQLRGEFMRENKINPTDMKLYENMVKTYQNKPTPLRTLNGQQMSDVMADVLGGTADEAKQVDLSKVDYKDRIAIYQKLHDLRKQNQVEFLQESRNLRGVLTAEKQLKDTGGGGTPPAGGGQAT